MASAYILRRDGSSEEMPRIRCRNEDRELQQILEANPDLLPGDQISPDDPRRWLIIKREMPVPSPDSGMDRWSIDFLFSDQDAIPTFVECKRYADTRSRREVVGQMLEYAANGHFYWTAEILRTYAAEAAAASGSTLESMLAGLEPTDRLSVDAYFETLQQNLREGQTRLIFFLEESPPELRSVVDFLNRQMERSEVLLVEARQYVHSGVKIVVPTLFGYTEEARFVKRSVAVSTPGTRRKWNRETYFADAREKLEPEQVCALETLLHHSVELGCIVRWGTGAQNGSFSISEPSVCQRSLISCYSNGDLTFNLHWLSGSAAEKRARAQLEALVAKNFAVEIHDKVGTGVPIEAWAGTTAEITATLTRVVADSRDLADFVSSNAPRPGSRGTPPTDHLAAEEGFR